MNKFGLTPSVKMPRSGQDLSHGLHTTMSVGKLYPIDWQEVLPGDTHTFTLGAVARIASSFIKPVMDNCYLEVRSFFVPLRLIDEGAEGIFGNPTPDAYSDNDLNTVPTFNAGTVSSGSVADYLGLPIGSVPKGISIYPFRAFAKIYNDWYRNENTVQEIAIYTKNSKGTYENLNNNVWGVNNYCGQLPNVAKHKDYFTSCLPAPQKGAPVKLPLGSIAPVKSYASAVQASQLAGLKWFYSETGTPSGQTAGTIVNPDTNNDLAVGQQGNTHLYGKVSTTDYGQADLALYTDLTNASSASVDEWRYALALQNMLEVDARFGSRYNEYIYGHYGVTSPDARLQFSEYLGGSRIPISVSDIAQTSQTTEASPLANVAGYSLTNGKAKVAKAFTEHGYLFTCACLRVVHSYQQGIEKKWTRVAREDFYDPLFSHIGEQPVYTHEIYAPSQTIKGQVFGYQEAWAEYRHIPNKITGQMHSGITNSEDVWHFGDYFTSQPYLVQGFTDETPSTINRTLTAPSNSVDNFVLDFYWKWRAIRVMPIYSTPSRLTGAI